jgi:Flp pilus assembly protein TadD
MNLQDQFDEAMFDFSRGDLDTAIAKLRAILEADPTHFDAQLALGMAYYRKGDYASALVEGHKAERLRPDDQLVHTNLSLFYLKAGDKAKAEHYGLQSRIAGWRAEARAARAASTPAAPPSPAPANAPARPPVSFPDMPWKKKKTEP